MHENKHRYKQRDAAPIFVHPLSDEMETAFHRRDRSYHRDFLSRLHPSASGQQSTISFSPRLDVDPLAGSALERSRPQVQSAIFKTSRDWSRRRDRDGSV